MASPMELAERVLHQECQCGPIHDATGCAGHCTACAALAIGEALADASVTGHGMGQESAAETIARLNRRAQRAESAALQNAEACARQGWSFGRKLAGWFGYAAVRAGDALLPFLRHRYASLADHCALFDDDKQRCTCGLDDARREWEKLAMAVRR